MTGERVRYICPICDHELKFGKHFCWNCKSRVDEPWVYTGGHLPNEGHDGCHPAQTYMKPRTVNTQPRSGHGKSLTGKNNAGKQYTYNRPGQNNSTSGHTGTFGGKSGNTNTPRKKNTGCGSLVFVVFIFYFLIQFLLIFLR